MGPVLNSRITSAATSVAGAENDLAMLGLLTLPFVGLNMAINGGPLNDKSSLNGASFGMDRATAVAEAGPLLQSVGATFFGFAGL